jgi:hypothetical protein
MHAEYGTVKWTRNKCEEKWAEINPGPTSRDEPSKLSTPKPTTHSQNEPIFSRGTSVTTIDSTLNDTYSAAKIFDQQSASILAQGPAPTASVTSRVVYAGSKQGLGAVRLPSLDLSEVELISPRTSHDNLSPKANNTNSPDGLSTARAVFITASDTSVDDTSASVVYAGSQQGPAARSEDEPESGTPSQGPPPKRWRLRSDSRLIHESLSDGQTGQDNLPCSSAAASVITSDNTSTPKDSSIAQTVNENKLILELDQAGMSLEYILERLQIVTKKTFQLRSLRTRRGRLRAKTYVWTEKDSKALRKAHEYLVQGGIEKTQKNKFEAIGRIVSLVTTIT